MSILGFLSTRCIYIYIYMYIVFNYYGARLATTYFIGSSSSLFATRY